MIQRDVVQRAAVPLLNTKRILAGGFSFKPVEGYTLEIADGSVSMDAPNADEGIGPTMLLVGGAESPLIQADTSSLNNAFDQFVSAMAQGKFEVGDKMTVSTQSLSGVAADLTNPKSDSGTAGRPFAGRVFMARPNPPQYFVLIAIAPAEEWEGGVAQEFDAVLDTVSLFTLTGQFTGSTGAASPNPSTASSSSTDSSPPTAVTQTNTSRSDTSRTPSAIAETESAVGVAPTPQPEAGRNAATSGSAAASATVSTNTSINQATSLSGRDSTQSAQWQAYTNGNFINEAIVVGNLVWAATNGGVVVWNQNSGSASKFTTADGLLANQNTAVGLCEFADLGVVFGTNAGLQIFNLGNGRWSTLNSENSLMSFDDVSDLYCDSTYGFMVIGYQRHGIDIFDANTDEWLHFDRNRALVSNVVRQLTVVGDRKELWIVSDLGLTILENIPEPDDRRSFFFNSENSPLEELPIDAMSKAADGAVWLAQENRLYRVRGETQSVAGSTQRDWSTFALDTVAGDVPRGPIRTLARANNQANEPSIWIGSEGRELCRFDPETVACTEFFDDGDRLAVGDATASLTNLFTSDIGDFLLSTQGDGISYFDGSRWVQLTIEDELLTSNSIRHLAQGKDGTIWVATAAEVQLVESNNGSSSGSNSGSNNRLPRLVAASSAQTIRRGNRNLFDGIQRGQPVTALWADDDGAIWLGTDAADLYNGTSWKSYTSLNGLAGSPVQAFAVDNQERVWIGTGEGLNVLNDETFFTLTTDQGLPDDNVQVIVAELDAPENVVWIGTAEGGLLRFEKNQLEVFNQANANLPSDSVTALALDGDGSLLIGTDNGLARLSGGSATKIRGVGDVSVTAIATGTASGLSDASGDDEAAMLWIGTQESGVFHYNGLAWEQLPSWNLPDQHITALLFDDDGTLWIGGANGGLMQHTTDPSLALP